MKAPRKVSPKRWASVRMFATDVDGTLTDGGLSFDEAGVERKVFHVRDGFGLVMLREAGIPIAWISGRASTVTTARARELKMPHVIQPVQDKESVLRQLAGKLGMKLEEVCYIGDDTNDLGAFSVAGIACAPADAHPDVLAAADHVCKLPGGRGAVREVCDLIIRHRPKP